MEHRSGARMKRIKLEILLLDNGKYAVNNLIKEAKAGFLGVIGAEPEQVEVLGFNDKEEVTMWIKGRI